MLSIGRLGPHGGRYYTDQVARGSEDYYIGAGEAPGRWWGSGLGSLGLQAGDVVAEDDFTVVLAGRHPRDGGQLVAEGPKRVQGFDLTFSAPKSVSLLWALHPDSQVRALVAAAHEAAVGDAVAFLESDALRARRGCGGTRRVVVEGLVAAGFAHRTSRAGDPQLHTHLVAANLVRDGNGRWSALDSRGLYRHARSAGFVYQARLRHELTLRLGVGWGPVRAGQADLAGIPRTVLEVFSSRRAEIEQALAKRGLSTANAARVATLDTRPVKPGADAAGLFGRWQQQAAEVGIDLAGLTGPGRQTEVPAGLVARLVGPAGLTAGASSFDRRDLIRAVAAGSPDGAKLAQLEAVAGEVVGRAGTVELTEPGADRPQQRWTTVDLLAAEADVVRRAERSAGQRVPRASAVAVKRALSDRPGLTAEQAALVAGVCTSASGVACVVGKAGAGKTFALDAARAAFEADGYTVIGAALSARAAAELEAGSGIASTTLARLLGDMATPAGRPPSGSVIVIDEAGMVGTRQLHTLITEASRWGWKTVLVGDHRQLPEIDAGGAYRRLCQTVPTWVLTVNQRQSEVWERAALDRLRSHQPSPALADYRRHGRITTADTAEAARAAMVADWHHDRAEGADSVMLAVRRADVAALNHAAQELRVQAGELDPDSAVTVSGRRFMAGDEVVCLRNDRRAGLTNGARLILTHLDPQSHRLEARGRDGQSVAVPWEYAQAGHVSLGYALTVHKAQGLTVDRARLLGDDRLFAEAGYVGLSRGRHTNHLYSVAPTPTDDRRSGSEIDHVIAALGISRAQHLSTAEVTAGPDWTERPLGELIQARDRLLEDIHADMPADPATQQGFIQAERAAIAAAPADAVWTDQAQADLELRERQLEAALDARHLWAARHRTDGEDLADLVAAIEERIADIGDCCRTNPPADLVDVLGPVPENPLERHRWQQAARPIAVWAETTGRHPRQLAASRAPRHPGERELWTQATAALEAHHLDRTQEKGIAI